VTMWALVCNQKTFTQRMALNEARFSEIRAKDVWSESLNVVSYNEHLLALMLFRDGYSLYPKGLADAAKRGAKPYWEKPNWQEEALKETCLPLH
jgi:hypothetical protein